MRALKRHILIVGLGFTLMHIACKKCETCSYTGTNQVTGNPVEFTYNEECGKISKKYNREECEAQAQTYQGQCTCVES